MDKIQERLALRQKLLGFFGVPVEDRMVNVDLDGEIVKTAYLQYGTAGGPPLVLLHGANTNACLWFPVMGKLAEHFTVIAPDIVGYGESDKPRRAPYDLPYFARWLAGFTQALGYQKIIPVGTSKGGVIALQLALDYPPLVEKMALVGTGGLGKVHMPTGLKWALLWWHLFPSKRTLARVRKFNKRQVVTEQSELFGRYRMLILKSRGGKQVFFKSARKVTRVLPDDELKRIIQPTLLIWGDEDIVFPREVMQRGVDLMQNARLEVVHAAEHIVFYDQPAEFNHILLAFLQG